MINDEQKSELLNRLVIDKNAAPEPEPLWSKPALLAPVCVLAGALITYLLIPSSPLEDSAGKPVPSATLAAGTSTATANTASATASASSNAAAQLAARDTKDAQILNASGYVTARLMATVASEVMALILTVEVDEGMTVEAGQVLARLDDTIARVNYQLALAQQQSQQARLASTRSELDEALRVLKRQQSLDKLTSEAQLTRAEADVARLRATIQALEAETEVARLAVLREKEVLNDYVIRAPFGGVVTQKNAQPGELVSPAAAGGGFTRTGICTIVDMASLEIEVDVNEAFIGRVFPGQKVLANLDAYPQWDIPARVIAVIPTADRSKATVQVRIQILEKDARILPDMGVKVAFLKAE